MQGDHASPTRLFIRVFVENKNIATCTTCHSLSPVEGFLIIFVILTGFSAYYETNIEINGMKSVYNVKKMITFDTEISTMS